MNVAVLGATGYIGSHLIPALLAQGHSVRAIARHAEVLEGRGWQGVEAVAADLLEAGSLEAALADCEVVYYLVHSMAGGRGFASRDREAATNARVAAERAGARRLIYLGGLQPAHEASEHLASRRDTGDVLRAGSVPVTELRAGIIVGPGSAAFEVVRDLVYHLPAMLTPRWVRSRTQPIALEDIVAYLVAVLDAPETRGGTYDVGGPEVLSYEEMLHQFGQLVGRNPRIIRVPVLSPRLSSYWLDLVTAVPASIARPLVDGLRHDLLADDEAIRRLVPLRLHTYREAVRAALDAERGDTRAGRWSEGSAAVSPPPIRYRLLLEDRDRRTPQHGVAGGSVGFRIKRRRPDRLALLEFPLACARMVGPGCRRDWDASRSAPSHKYPCRRCAGLLAGGCCGTGHPPSARR
jgi:uncharacterized protein YbjT (DUF2867 family)